jgi:hypothetical protein
MAENDSLYNTAPTYAIYVTGLVMEWVAAEGGVAAMDTLSDRKAQLCVPSLFSPTPTCTDAGLRSAQAVRRDRRLRGVLLGASACQCALAHEHSVPRVPQRPAG